VSVKKSPPLLYAHWFHRHKEQAGRQDIDRIVRDLLDLERVRNLFRMAYDRRRFVEVTAANRRRTYKGLRILHQLLPRYSRTF
jgi:hypothetical protein